MSDADYTRRYFSDSAQAWLADAYADGADAAVYPVGARRVGLALGAVRERLGGDRGRLVDLGCGGGDLCADAAALGFETLGIDVAEGMIAQAEARRAALPEAARARMRVMVGDALKVADGTRAEAVTALGLLEYLPDDRAFFAQAAALLRPGGVLVVSCRNRLFNMVSLNEYTRREYEGGEVLRLLDELAGLGPGANALDAISEFVVRLREALPLLEAALAADRAQPPAGAADAGTAAGFAQPRRQHTPHGLARAAAAAGFIGPRFIGVHPHPWPPAWERTAPRVYNRLASVYEALERTPGSLAWSSSFLGVFTR